MRKPIYDARGWVLGICSQCLKTNYVEPHGTDQACQHVKKWSA
jgi:hypothetical protein